MDDGLRGTGKIEKRSRNVKRRKKKHDIELKRSCIGERKEGEGTGG